MAARPQGNVVVNGYHEVRYGNLTYTFGVRYGALVNIARTAEGERPRTRWDLEWEDLPDLVQQLARLQGVPK